MSPDHWETPKEGRWRQSLQKRVAKPSINGENAEHSNRDDEFCPTITFALFYCYQYCGVICAQIDSDFIE